jgi:hypothetical protein
MIVMYAQQAVCAEAISDAEVILPQNGGQLGFMLQ